MNNSSAVYVRINAEDKTNAESILRLLGVTPSSVIQMLYKQIIVRRGIPFSISLPEKPIAIGNMSEDEVEELARIGDESGKEKTYTLEEVREMLKKM